MPTRAVIFDRDGVLTRFDFAPLQALLTEVAPRLDLRVLWDEWHAYYTSTALPDSTESERAYLAQFWDSVCAGSAVEPSGRERLRDFDYRRTIRAFDDARPTLMTAQAQGLRVGVLSNFPLVSLEESLDYVGLSEFVNVARAATVSGTPKPHPDAYLRMLDALGVAPSECVLVDDELPCVEGARNVGIRAYLLDRRATAPDERAQVLPDLLSFARILSA